MKIAIVLWELDITGGTQRQALELARELQNMRHTVHVYSYFFDRNKGFRDLYNDLSIYSVAQRDEKGAKPILAEHANALYRLLYKGKVYANLVRNIFSVGKPLRDLKSLIEKEHSVAFYDAINLHDYEVYRMSRVLAHKNIVWMMNDLQRGHTWRGNFLLRIIFQILQKILLRLELRNIAKITVLDNRNKSLCKKLYGQNAFVVRSGINLDMFSHISIQKSFSKREYHIFASSIFFPYRRFEDLVDAVSILLQRGYTNIHTTINGVVDRAHAYYQFIQDRILKESLDKYVTITKGLPEAGLIKTYAESDIFVFPNNNQTWGLAVFEAMLAGSVCIVSRGAGAHEVLTHGENAMLVNPNSPEEIANTIAFLLDHPEEMRRIAKNGTQFVRENLSWAKYANQMVKIFTTPAQNT